MSGKLGTAPCGHPGTHVTANFVTCNQGCDAATPIVIEVERTEPVYRECPYCSSTNFTKRTLTSRCHNCTATWLNKNGNRL